MAGEYLKYKVVEGDSLIKIAKMKTDVMDPEDTTDPEKDLVERARKIWKDGKNRELYTEKANMHGKRVNRKLHMGNNRYVDYDDSRWGEGYRAYDDPHQIILYSGEDIWIPLKANEVTEEDRPAENQTVEATEIEYEEREISAEELINGFVPDTCKRYKLKFPVFAVRLEMKDVNEDDVFILTGNLKNENDIIFKKTLTIRDDQIKGDQYVDLHFVGTPKNLEYTLVVEPGPEDTSEQDNAEDADRPRGGEQEESQEGYTVFSGEPYPKEEKKHSDSDGV